MVSLVKRFCDFFSTSITDAEESILQVEAEPTLKTSNPPFRCQVCSKNFSSVYSLLRHTKSIHWGIAMAECLECGRTFRDKSELKYHTESCHENGSHACQEEGCEKIFTTKQALKRH
jgi:KRAB domain-containing zinc finger protein